MSNAKTTFVATTPRGQVFTRSSGTMKYTHVLVLTERDSVSETAQITPSKQWVTSWHTSEALAVKAGGNRWFEKYLKSYVAVEAFPYSSPEAKAARKADVTKQK